MDHFDRTWAVSSVQAVKPRRRDRKKCGTCTWNSNFKRLARDNKPKKDKFTDNVAVLINFRTLYMEFTQHKGGRNFNETLIEIGIKYLTFLSYNI